MGGSVVVVSYTTASLHTHEQIICTLYMYMYRYVCTPIYRGMWVVVTPPKLALYYTQVHARTIRMHLYSPFGSGGNCTESGQIELVDSE